MTDLPPHQCCDSAQTAAKPADWLLYLLHCTGDVYYAGITNNMDKRWKAHVSGKGAKFTRARPPLRIIGTKSYPDRASASRGEWDIKQLPRAKKVQFLDIVFS